jgi:hypothetical protein
MFRKARSTAVRYQPGLSDCRISGPSCSPYLMYRVIHKSLRDFRHLRYSSRDGHAEVEHVNRGTDTQSFCPTSQVFDVHSWWRGSCQFLANSKDTERFVIPSLRHVSSRLPPSGETCKYATTPSTQRNLDRFSTYWYTPFCCICLGFCAAEFESSGVTYELPCI